jgi:predicted membrane chloride channel (bestrophin family)
MEMHLPWYIWPVSALMQLLHHLFFVFMHSLATFLGLSFIAVGLMLTGTIIAAPIGLPLILAGVYLRYRYKFFPF